LGVPGALAQRVASGGHFNDPLRREPSQSVSLGDRRHDDERRVDETQIGPLANYIESFQEIKIDMSNNTASSARSAR